MVRNPFLEIVPAEEEELIELEGMNIDDIVEKIKQGGKIILIVGEHGSGKSQLIKELRKRVYGDLIGFDFNIFDRIRRVKSGPLYIEDFDLINGLSSDKQKKLVSLIEDKSKLGITFVIECTPQILKRIKFENQIEFKMPEFTLEAAKKLVISRLNRVRQESNSLSPFTEDEIEKAWKKSGYNPRMFLMILSTLYDIKVKR